MPIKKDKLIKAVAITTLFVIFFTITLSKQTHKAGYEQEISNPEEKNEENLDKEQEEGERFFESFILTYNSYRLGSTLNIENLYGYMDEEMIKKEKAKVSRLKEEYPAYKEFITVESNLKNSKVESYEKERLKIQISIEKTIIEGAFVPDPLGDENDEFILINKSGAIYEGNAKDLIKDSLEETFIITGSKQSGDWKISEIQKIS